jgi:hypothetical protein
MTNLGPDMMLFLTSDKVVNRQVVNI